MNYIIARARACGPVMAWRGCVGRRAACSFHRPKERFRARAASPVESRPLTKEDLVDYFRRGCKRKEDFRIGTEHEKFGFRRKDNSPISYSEIREVLQRIGDRFGWEKVYEGPNVIGLEKDGQVRFFTYQYFIHYRPCNLGSRAEWRPQSISLEPGGQFELSGAPLETIHQTCAEVNSHLYQVKAVSEEMGLRFLGLGFNPKWRREDMPIMPKERYDIMRSYMPQRGSLGLDMMLRTCTIQVNLDFESEEDMVRKFRTSLALQPIATALFANSPFKEGEPSGFVSYRSHIWTDTDPDRTGDLPFVFEDGFGFERYVDYMLSVPMYLIKRDGKVINCAGQSFVDFMQGNLAALPGEYPTMEDWELHLSTTFPEVRMKKFLEMRGADGGPWRRICALPALWAGILYDDEALRRASELVADWTKEERAYLRANVPRTGLQTPFRDGTVLDVAKEVLDIAKKGLSRRGHQEKPFLQTLENIVARGRSSAEDLLELYRGDWGGDIDRVYSKMVY